MWYNIFQIDVSWPLRLSVRTSRFQCEKASSILAGVTSVKQKV